MKWQLRKYFFHNWIVFVFLVFKDKSFFLNNSKSLSNIKIFNRASDLFKSFGGDMGINFCSFWATLAYQCLNFSKAGYPVYCFIFQILENRTQIRRNQHGIRENWTRNRRNQTEIRRNQTEIRRFWTLNRRIWTRNRRNWTENSRIWTRICENWMQIRRNWI